MDGAPDRVRATVEWIGERTVLVLPDDALARVGLAPGDTLVLAESEADRQLRLARNIMAERREVLAQLAQ